MSAVLLDVSGLCKSYGARRAVDGVSFQVLAGQTVGLIGPNGAGKSTTVGMLCGLLRPDAGQVLLDGAVLGPGASAAKHRIGLVPQDVELYEDLSARENLKLFGALYGLRGATLRERTERVLALVKLADRAGDRTSTFSGGMKRRLNIAAALLHEPQLLILDEPTVGVDPQSRNAIFDTLERLKAEGRSLIYTSHYMEEVERLADHIVILDHGKVLADESPAALYRRLPAQAALRFACLFLRPARQLAVPVSFHWRCSSGSLRSSHRPSTMTTTPTISRLALIARSGMVWISHGDTATQAPITMLSRTAQI
jgi:ABC-2 type transport system ATP-binding protein